MPRPLLPWSSLCVLPALLLTGATAHALDVPLLGKTLIVRRTSNGKERLRFTGVARGLPLPVPASAGDPLTSSLAGAFIDVVSSGASPVGVFVAPSGTVTPSDPGWTRSANGSSLRYKNTDAPSGESVVRALVLKRGKKLKLIAMRTGLALAGGEGTVGVRVTIGKGTADEIRYCSQFAPGQVVRDRAGAYAAKKAPASALADCSDAALGTYGTLPDALPLDVPTCGPGFDGPGHSQTLGGDLHRVTLHGAGEVCNDGTPAVFYIREANPGGGHEDDWLIWLEGGGNCGNAETCADRWCGTRSQGGYGAHKMSSRYTLPAVRGYGIFTQAAANRFRDFNMVQTYYCSSDNYVGRDSIDVAPRGLYPGYKLQFNGQTILRGIMRRLRDGVTSDDGVVTLPPLGTGSKVLYTGTSGGGQGATYNINRVAAWAASIPVASFSVSIDARVAPSYDDTTSLTDAQKAEDLRRNAFVGRFRNDILDEACVAQHEADPRICFDSGHLLLHHVQQTFFVNQDLEDPVVGFEPFADMEAFTDAERSYLADQFLQRTTVAEDAAVRALPLPTIFAPRCNQHVYLESEAFYDNRLRVPPAAFTSYNDNLYDWWSGGSPPSMIDGIGGAVTDLANCFN